ncbi:sodium:solute symporter [Saprospiraceae bacterium]|nr:sodium:solute symporter [Saprospiraceae bacterium]
MSPIDWVILICTLATIVIYGVYKTYGAKNMNGYLLGDQQAKWWTVGLSVMATQASAITFLSTPGQAYHSGMGFVQFYFGLPIAMVIICVSFIPIYHKLKVYTAYEFLESRFDLKTRSLTAILFLIQRGLGAGITIFAPAIILSTILKWNLSATILIIGTLVIIYTVLGGTRAVNVTQKQQMTIIMIGMIITFFTILNLLPADITFSNALQIAGAGDKLDILDFSFDLENKYTVWTGLTGGVFLMLSYFGTDQSQVARYLSGKSIKESRLGLIFNGLVKVPMQFFILLIGVMVFVFYQFNQAPIFFNEVGVEKVMQSEYKEDFQQIQKDYDQNYQVKKELQLSYASAINTENASEIERLSGEIKKLHTEELVLRDATKELIKKADSSIETNDRDYVFINFILNQLPRGLIGLLLAVILSAAMSSCASELNALGSTTSVDIYKRSLAPGKDEEHYVNASKWLTLLWGVIAIMFAAWGTLFENLIQLVNIIGSLFYGAILGVFVVAFYIKWIKGNAVFISALISEAIVIYIYFLDIVPYLWLNLIGCVLVLVIAALLQALLPMNLANKTILNNISHPSADNIE